MFKKPTPIVDELDEYVAEDPEVIAEKVRSGEYFREVKNAYATIYLDPMSERYYILLIFIFSLFIFLMSLLALDSIMPLRTEVPFGYLSRNPVSETPRMQKLASSNADTNAAVKNYLIREYVSRRESYNIDQLEMNVRFVKAQSSPEVYERFERLLDPTNPESPISQFQRHSQRNIRIVGMRPYADNTVDVLYEAEVVGREESQKYRMVATVAFQYSGVTIDQDTEEAIPLRFTVTDYRLRRLQE